MISIHKLLLDTIYGTWCINSSQGTWFPSQLDPDLNIIPDPEIGSRKKSDPQHGTQHTMVRI